MIDTFLSDIVAKALRSRVVGKTVADRVSQLGTQQKAAARSILLRGLKKGDDPATLAQKLEKFYASAPGGSPAYQARRLVQSEMTRFEGRMAEEIGQQLAQETTQIPIYIYNTQRDDLVRPEHEANDGTEYTLDEYSGPSGYPPISEAQDYLSDPNCRCWLDLDRWEDL